MRTVSRNLSVQLGESSAAAAQTLAKQGLGEPPERPGSKPPLLPEDLTDQSDRELMKLLTRLGKWVGYLGYQKSAAEVDERFAATKVERMAALAQIKNKGGSVSAMKASVWDSDEYSDAKRAEQEAYAYRKLVEALYNAVDKDSFTVSRELTRRTGRNDREKRQQRWED